MATILRSGKFVRYFASLTRSFVFSSVRETEGSFLQNSQCLCSSLSKGFATAAVKPDHSLERSLKRLDQDVRRTGRISRRDIEDVLEEIRLQRSATSSQSLLVIRCCGSLVPEELPEVRTALVQEIWKTLNALNVPMDISHYNALLRVYLENEHAFSPTEFLSELEAKGVEPNRVTYQRLIARYCQLGDIEGATRILEYMRERELPVNENVFNALIVGHSQANDMVSAAGILAVMKQAGLEPSADTYTTLLCCYARHGDLEKIMRVLEECDKNEIYLLDKDILDVIYALAINGNSDKVDPLLERIRKSAGYNQDAVNLILRLINKGYEDVAYKILKTMPRSTKADGSLNETGSFFIRQLVRANRPIDNILKFCKNMQDEGLNSRALLIAAESSLSTGVTSSALPLLNELKNLGTPIRQHYFWPLICSIEPNQIVDVLKKMQEEFNISPSGETLRDYVIPNLKEKNLDRIVTLLRGAGVSVANACAAAAYAALQSYKLKEAADIAASYQAYYSPGLFRKPLVIALSKTNDFDSYIKFTRCLYEYLPRGTNLLSNQAEVDDVESSTSETPTVNQADILGQIVMDAVIYFKRDRAEILENILQGLVGQGLSISNAYANKIQERLASEMTPTISELLGKLTTGDLEPTAFEKADKLRRNFDSLSIQEIENLIAAAEAKNENPKGLKRNLLIACVKERNVEKTEEVMNKLEKEDFVIPTGTFAQVIDLYCNQNKLDSAISLYEKIRSKEPDFALDNLKTIKMVDLLLKENRFDEALEFLNKNKKDEAKIDSSFNYNTTCWRLLNTLAETGNADNLKKVFDSLIANNYVEINNVLLGPLVKVHIVNNDLQKAVDTFEEICNKYQATPWKNDLACRLIQAEDAANLQRLTDLSTNIHGEVNSLYDLVFSFVECGRIRQARKILETPGLRSKPQRINSACERYRQEGMVQPLEGLVEATKHLNHIDRGDIYYNLLLTYCKEDQPEKALGLWTKMQEEDISPSDEFLLKLGEYLKSKNLEVPFVMPTVVPKSSTPPTTPNKAATSADIQVTGISIKSKPEISEPKQIFRRAVRAGDVDAALSAVQNLGKDKLSIQDRSSLIEALVKAGRITEATKNVEDMLQENLHPIPRIFKFYLNKLAMTGDVNKMENFSKVINAKEKKLVSFDNRLCSAYLAAGKIENYLNKLKDDIESANTKEEISAVEEKFPRGGAVGILESHPELLGKFEEIAEKYASKGILGPINVLWAYHFNNGNDEASKKIWDEHLSKSPRLMFQKILQTARERQDENLIKKLITYLKSAKITEGAIGTAYSCWLDVLSSQEKFKEALDVLKAGINDVCLDNFNRTALVKVKTGLEARGESFPYKIPEKIVQIDTTSSSSSSSSSDDDMPPSRTTMKSDVK